MKTKLSPRQEHLIKGMRYWLVRAGDKLDKGYESHAKISINKALESLGLIEQDLISTPCPPDQNL